MENELKDFINEVVLGESILDALESFYNNDYSQFFGTNNDGKHTSVYEVAISCKLGIYIFNNLKEAKFFKGQYSKFSVDMEYNKMGLEMMDKEIPEIKKDCKNSTDKIRPDIIIHERGAADSANNLCVFEIKKGRLTNCDKVKLEGFTCDNRFTFQYKYGIGLFNFKNDTVNIDLYQNGKIKGTFIYKKGVGINKKES